MTPPTPPQESPRLPPAGRGLLLLLALWAGVGLYGLATGQPCMSAGGLLAAGSLGLAVAAVRRAEGQRLSGLQRERIIHEQAAQLATQAREREQQARELAEARDEALRAAQAKDMFLANMSHELRTPLNSVIGFSGLLADTPLNEQQQEYIDIIEKSSRSLLDLIGDILDVSKLEAGQLSPETRPFDLRSCVEDALDMVAAQAHAKGLELVADVSNEAPAVLVSDLARLRQILVNLLSNAVKFTAEGQVVVRVSAQAVESPWSELRFDVIDSGIGIPEDRQNRLFLPFSQVDASTTRQFGGTGLGLAISKALAGLLGGRMWVESEAGRGSTFSFTIQAETEQREPPGAARGRRVLLVDDNEAARGAASRMLQGLGAAAVGVASGPEALEAARRGPFDLVLLDQSVAAHDSSLVARLSHQLGEETQVALLAPRGHRERPAPGVILLPKPLRLASLVACFAPASARPPEAREFSASAPLVALRVLVVEDNPLNRKVLLKMLEKLGHTADAVSTGAEALEVTQRQRYRVILLDVNMPDMDGYQVAAALCSRIPRRLRPRIIGATANALPGDREKCIAAGMDDYLTKPIELQALARVLGSPDQPSEPTWSVSSSILDPNLIQQARTGREGEANLRLLCAEFIEKTPALLVTLLAAIEEQDTEAIAAASAELNRLARAVGAVQLSAALLSLGILLNSGRLTEIDELRDRVKSLAERTEQAVGRIARDLAGRTSGGPPA